MKLPSYLLIEIEKENLSLEEKAIILILYQMYFMGTLPNKDESLDISREFFCKITHLSWVKLKNKLLRLKELNLFDFKILDNGEYDNYKIYFNQTRYIRKEVREEIFKLNNSRCQNCSMTNQDHKIKYNRSLEMHHIIPYHKNGKNELNNLKLLCKECHKNEL